MLVDRCSVILCVTMCMAEMVSEFPPSSILLCEDCHHSLEAEVSSGIMSKG